MQKVCKVCNKLVEFGTAARSLTCPDCLSAGYKYCSTCDTVKPTAMFRKAGFSLTSKCIACLRIYNADNSRKLYRNSEERRQYIKDTVKATRATEKGRLSANSYSSKYYSTEAGKEQNRLASRRWYSSQEGRLYAKNKSHRRRQVMGDGNISIDEWTQALEYFDYSCAYCGKVDELTLDHIVPLSANGEHAIFNVVPACKSCNSSKCARQLDEWYKQQKYFDELKLERILKWRNEHEC